MTLNKFLLSQKHFPTFIKTEKIGERGIKFTFKDAGNAELPLILSQLPVLPKHFWEGKEFAMSGTYPDYSITMDNLVGKYTFSVHAFDIAGNRSEDTANGGF